MKHAVLAIYEEELDYAAHLADYLGRKERKFSETRVFTNEKSLEDFLDNYEVDILLIGENLFRKRQDWFHIRQFVLLSEGTLVAEDLINEQIAIYKFQSAENICRELNDIYAMNEKPQGKKKTEGNTRIIGIFSPCGGSRKTIFSISLAEVLAKKKTVLYLNLECFSGISRQVYENSIEGLSELIYYIREKNVALLQKIQSMICKMSTFDTIAPVNHFRDLMEISEDDVDTIMGELKGSAVYDYIIIDLGYFYISTFRWLSWCDIAFLTGGKDKISTEKKKTLRHYMQMEGQEELWNNFYDIQIPKVKNMLEERILQCEQENSIEEFAREIQQEMIEDYKESN